MGTHWITLRTLQKKNESEGTNKSQRIFIEYKHLVLIAYEIPLY